jgi:hypothetical protein
LKRKQTEFDVKDKEKYKEIHLGLKIAIQDVLKSKSKVKQRLQDFTSGKDPITYRDVKHIIEAIPENLPGKPYDASLFLFALYTGSRGISCINILLKDILNVLKIKRACDNRSIIIIQIRIARSKGVWGSNHQISIEGDDCWTTTTTTTHCSSSPTANNNSSSGGGVPANNIGNEANDHKLSTDFIYWLQQHVADKWSGLHLINDFGTEAWTNAMALYSTRRVWPGETDAIRERLKRRAVLAGFPESLFGFHSFRAGFICSAFINAGNDASVRAGIIEQTALVGGWVPNGKSQLVYLKKNSS